RIVLEPIPTRRASEGVFKVARLGLPRWRVGLVCSAERTLFQRPLLHAGILAAAVGVPYVLLNERLGQTARGVWSSVAGKSAAEKTEAVRLTGVQLASTGTAAPSPAVAIEQAFRFDVSPQWVISRW